MSAVSEWRKSRYRVCLAGPRVPAPSRLYAAPGRRHSRNRRIWSDRARGWRAPGLKQCLSTAMLRRCPPSRCAGSDSPRCSSAAEPLLWWGLRCFCVSCQIINISINIRAFTFPRRWILNQFQGEGRRFNNNNKKQHLIHMVLVGRVV